MLNASPEKSGYHNPENLDNNTEKKDELDYKPFDPENELKAIRALTPEQEDLSDKEKRGVRRERLGEYKKNLEKQKRVTGETVRGLWGAVHENADSTVKELQAIVRNNASEGKFTKEQIDNFSETIRNYQERHQRVVQIKEKFQDRPDELYKEVFGAYPIGDITVEFGPMTINFICYTKEDFGFCIGSSSKTIAERTDDRKEYWSKLVEKGKKTRAIAFPKIKGKQMFHGIITAVKAEFKKSKSALEEKRIRLRDDEYWLEIDEGEASQTNEYFIDVSEEKTWKIKVERNDSGDIKKITIFDSDDANGTPKNEFNVDSNFTNHTIPLDRQGLNGHVTIDEYSIEINNHDPDNPITIRFNTMHKPDTREIANFSRHEEQHQFNNLFTHSELSPRGENIEMDWSIIYRGDQSARDEVLAQYAGGIDPQEIHTIMMDYLPRYYDETDKEKAIQYTEREAPNLSRSEVQQKVNQRFGVKFENTVQTWCGAIKNLEEKNYKPDEIIAMLMAEPAKNWHGLAKRAKLKK